MKAGTLNRSTRARVLASALASVAVLALGVPPASAAPGDLVTIAGGGLARGSVATNVGMAPMGIAVVGDTAYIADVASDAVRAVDLTTGAARVVAGQGRSGSEGDGGPATSALLNNPYAVAAGADGTLFIADSGNDRIRRIAPDGTITSVGAGALLLPTDVAVDSSGAVIVADFSHNLVKRIDGAGNVSVVAGTGSRLFNGESGPATSINIQPQGVDVDAVGRILIADRANGRVRRVDAGGTLTTVASGLAEPIRVREFNSAIYVAERGAERVRTIADDGTSTIVAGNGQQRYDGDGRPALESAMDPSDMAMTADGSLLVADNYNNRIRHIAATDSIVTTVAGTGSWAYGGEGGPAVEAQLNNPVGILTRGSDIVFSDSWNARLHRVDASGTIATIAGGGSARWGDGGPAIDANLYNPRGIAADAVGNLYIADDFWVRKIDSAGIITSVAGGGTDGADGIPATSARMWATDVVVAPDGTLYISDRDHVVRRVDPRTGLIFTVAGTRQPGFSGDGGPATAAKLSMPWGLALDGSGNLLIADTANQRIRRVDLLSGVISTVVGGGSETAEGLPAKYTRLREPLDVLVDSAGNLFFTEFNGGRIRRVGAAGLVFTVGGTGGVGYVGDGPDARRQPIVGPMMLALSSNGDLYFTEWGYRRVRRIENPLAVRPDLAGGRLDPVLRAAPQLANLLDVAYRALPVTP